MHQNSVFSTLSFPKYSSQIGRIAGKHIIKFHLYADDTQLYVVIDAEDGEATVAQLEKCISKIRAWTRSNKLKHNDSKTEFLVISSKHSHQVPDVSSISIGDANG